MDIWIYIHTCIHTYIHACMQAYIHAYIHAYTHTYCTYVADVGERLAGRAAQWRDAPRPQAFGLVGTPAHTDAPAHMHTCTHARHTCTRTRAMQTCTHAHTWMWTHMYVCPYTCGYC